jgi:hypothetical protein
MGLRADNAAPDDWLLESMEIANAKDGWNDAGPGDDSREI